MNYTIIPGLIERPASPIKFFSADRILQVVCEYFGITREKLLERSNKNEVVYPRQIAMYILRRYSRLSLREIKQQVTLQNHTSPIHSNKKIKGRMDVDDRVKFDVQEIIKNL